MNTASMMISELNGNAAAPAATSNHSAMAEREDKDKKT